jgi:hypothetical protein
MAINNQQSGTRSALLSAVTGGTPISNSAFEQAVAAAVLPGALYPPCLSRYPTQPELNIPAGFANIYAQILAQDRYRI